MKDELIKNGKKKKAVSKKIAKMKGQIAEHQGLIEIMLGTLSSQTEGQEIDNFLEFVTASKHHSKQAQHAAREKQERDPLGGWKADEPQQKPR